MHIGFDVSQTGANKAGCGYYAHALANALPQVDGGRRYSFYPDFGDFFFDARMPFRNPYHAPEGSYGPRHLTREGAAAFWNAPDYQPLRAIRQKASTGRLVAIQGYQ